MSSMTNVKTMGTRIDKTYVFEDAQKGYEFIGKLLDVHWVVPIAPKLKLCL